MTNANPLGLRRSAIQANTLGVQYTDPGAAAQYTQQQRMILEAFRAQQYVQDAMDVQAEPVYDTVSLVATNIIQEKTATAQFFVNVANKTLNLTNMTQPNQLMSPEALAVFCYRFYLDPRNTVADCEAVLAGFAWEFTMGRKAYQTIPLWMIPQGGGLDFQGTIAGATIVHNGRPDGKSIRPIAITLILEQNVSFFATLMGPNYTITGANFIMASILDGLHARGIQ